MNHPHPHHPETDGRTPGGEIKGPYWKRAHQDWKFWIALILMLLAIGTYIVTLDLSVQPNAGDKIQQPSP